MHIEKWCHGCKVTVSDWIDKQRSIWVYVECFAPGQAISRPPIWTESIIIPREQEATVISYLDSIVWNICTRPAKEPRREGVTA